MRTKFWNQSTKVLLVFLIAYTVESILVMCCLNMAIPPFIHGFHATIWNAAGFVSLVNTISHYVHDRGLLAFQIPTIANMQRAASNETNV